MSSSFIKKKGGNSSALFSSELILLFTIFAISIFLFITTFYFDEVPPILVRGIQPATFPKILLGLIFSLNALLVYFYFKRPKKDHERLGSIFYKTIAIFFIFPIIALKIDLILALMLSSIAIAYFWGEKNLVLILTLSILFPILVFLLFEGVLGLRFPPGILTNIYYNW